MIAEVRKLSIGYSDSQGNLVPVLHDIDLTIEQGRNLGLAGESGSGKSTLALALTGALGHGAVRTGGDVILFDATGEPINLLTASDSILRSVWGRDIGYLPQSPAKTLTSTLRIGSLLIETIRTHHTCTPTEARRRAEDVLRRVQLPATNDLLRRYPHQLSGGQQQRVALALALAGDPRILILDEPTTGLDATTKLEIIDLLSGLREEHRTIICISHDLGVLARLCDDIAVVYAGKIVESGPVDAILRHPAHPYTRSLAAVRTADAETQQPAATGMPLELGGVAGLGCDYTNRCPYAGPECHSVRPPDVADLDFPGRIVMCHNPLLSQQDQILVKPTDEVGKIQTQPAYEELLSVSGATVHYRSSRRQKDAPVGIHDVSVTVGAGETVALIGESGSGKSTLARCIAGVLRPAAGGMQFQGRSLPAGVEHRDRAQRRAITVVLQHPETALNPRHRVRDIIARPARLHLGISRRDAYARAQELMAEVGLAPDLAGRLPRHLSGGQRQRVAIAAALASSPSLIICDEVVSALDVSTAATVIALLRKVQEDHGVGYLFITHDIAIAEQIAHRLVVLQNGRVIEQGRTADVLQRPQDPYTRKLVAAARMGEFDRDELPTMQGRR